MSSYLSLKWYKIEVAVFKVGKYFSEDYAEAVCEKYISLGLYSSSSKVKVDLSKEKV